MITAYLVDDEPLAVKRLRALLDRTGRVDIVGAETDPAAAREFLLANPVDLLFLDIHMPEIDGFALLDSLPRQPFVVFTTAHDRHALDAFRVLAVDYLLKPIVAADLARALDKVDRLRAAAGDMPEVTALLRELERRAAPAYPQRVSSRLGDRIAVLELAEVSCFRAADKLTYAVVAGKEHVVDESISQLEARLDPHKFVRIHRSALVNVEFVSELHADPIGTTVRLKDPAATELPVARDRVKLLRERLGIPR